MSRFLILLILIFIFFTKNLASKEKLAYDFTFNDIESGRIELSNYKDKTLIVVNVASRCGFTNQYKDLQNLWIKYKEQGLVIIAVPSNNFKQEPGTNADIKTFCKNNFSIDFPITEKTNVVGKNAHPFFLWAKESYGIAAVPKWNFHKIIINSKGKVSNSFSSITNPSSKKFISYIEKEIKN